MGRKESLRLAIRRSTPGRPPVSAEQLREPPPRALPASRRQPQPSSGAPLRSGNGSAKKQRERSPPQSRAPVQTSRHPSPFGNRRAIPLLRRPHGRPMSKRRAVITHGPRTAAISGYSSGAPLAGQKSLPARESTSQPRATMISSRQPRGKPRAWGLAPSGFPQILAERQR